MEWSYDLRMTAGRTPQYVSYEEFLRTEAVSDEKHEWVDGVVYAMSRGSPEHGRLVARVIRHLLGPLSDDGCETFASDAPIFIEAASQHTYADASLVCGLVVTRVVRDKNQKSIGEAVTNPCVIVEVLSETTERYDRDGKFEAYKKLPSFDTYVLVSQDERRIEVRTRDGERWTAHVGGPGAQVRIHGRDVAVDSVYG